MGLGSLPDRRKENGHTSTHDVDRVPFYFGADFAQLRVGGRKEKWNDE
jgi:hypothetical protein